MKYRIIVGDMHSMVQDARPEDLPEFLDEDAPGVFDYEFEVPNSLQGKLLPAEDFGAIVRAFAYKTLFFKNFTAEDTFSLIQEQTVDGRWRSIDL